jgi:hypothetical protein
MAARGDRNHDIAAWFGVNQGRIAEAKEGKFGNPPAAPPNQLPPSGAPGIKGRRLRAQAEQILTDLSDAKQTDADARAKTLKALQEAISRYDKNEG